MGVEDGLVARQLCSTSYRFGYLTYNLFSQMVGVLAGVLVYRATNSLSVQLSMLGSSCDLLAVAINIIAEILKKRATSVRSVLIFDLCGCAASLFLLIGVSAFGAVHAFLRATDEDQDAHLHHFREMLFYSVSMLAMGFADLGLFAALRSRMMPSKDVAHDELNLWSVFLHIIADIFGNLVVIGTSLWLSFGSFKGERSMERAQHRIHIDALGAIAVVACISLSICWISRDLMQTWDRLRKLPATEGPGSEAQAMVVESYGTMSDPKSGRLDSMP